MSKYIVIVTPFKDFVKSNFPNHVQSPVDLPQYWNDRIVIVKLDRDLDVGDLQKGVAAPGRPERHIELFWYHKQKEYCTYCNEEFLYFREHTSYADNWIIRGGSDDDMYGICGSIVITAGVDIEGDTPGISASQLYNLMLKYFCNHDLAGLWPDSAPHRKMVEKFCYGDGNV